MIAVSYEADFYTDAHSPSKGFQTAFVCCRRIPINMRGTLLGSDNSSLRVAGNYSTS